MIQPRSLIETPYRRLAIATVATVSIAVAVAYVLGLFGTGRPNTPSATDQATTTLAAVPAACDTYAANLPITLPGAGPIAQALVMNAHQSGAAIAAAEQTCKSVHRGTGLASLDQLPYTWNAQCVTTLGGTLRADRNPGIGRFTDLDPNTDGTIDATRYAACISFRPTSEQCETLRKTFNPIALSVEQTAIMRSVGCQNVEVRPRG